MQKALLPIVLVLSLISGVFAQPGSLDLTFNPDDKGFGNGVLGRVWTGPTDGVYYTGSVYSISIQQNGKIIIGGDFKRVNGQTRNGIARLESDGMVDTSFNPRTNFNPGFLTYQTVFCTEIQQDGKIIIGGNLIVYGLTQTKMIARLNPDGSFDPTFKTGTGFNNIVKAIAIQPDGKILVGGHFTSFNDIETRHLSRLNPDGTFDQSFLKGDGFNKEVEDICIQPDGKILVVGDFTTYNSLHANRIIRLNPDGSIDLAFNSGEGCDDRINDVELSQDGKIVLAGKFTKSNGINMQSICRLLDDGTMDNSFGPVSGSKYMEIHSIAIQPDNKIVAAGAIFKINGQPVNNIVRFNRDGKLDETFTFKGSFLIDLNKVVLRANGQMYIGGWFRYVDFPIRNGIALLKSDGQIDSSFHKMSGIDGRVFASADQSDGKILVGGMFSSANGHPNYNLVRLHRNGTYDMSFKTTKVFYPGVDNTVTKEFGSEVTTIAIQNDDKILLGGVFNQIDDKPCKFVARLDRDGSIDDSFKLPQDFGGTIRSVFPLSNGKILVGGEVRYNNGQSKVPLVRLLSDGAIDINFDAQFSLEPLKIEKCRINCITVQKDGKTLCGGYFLQENGTKFNKVIRLHPDGTLDLSFDSGIGFNHNVLSLNLQADGKILCGGSFTTYEGNPIFRLVRLNQDGSLDNSFTAAITSHDYHPYTGVETIAIEPEGKIIIGGYFNFVNGMFSNYIARLNTDGSLDSTFKTGQGFNEGVYTLIIQPDGNIVAGGDFMQYNGTGKNGIARLIGGAISKTAESDDIKTIRLYPNPTTGKVNIQLDKKHPDLSLTLVDIFGRTILQKHFTDTQNIDLELSSQPGLYFVTLNSADGWIKTIRVVKH